MTTLTPDLDGPVRRRAPVRTAMIEPDVPGLAPISLARVKVPAGMTGGPRRPGPSRAQLAVRLLVARRLAGLSRSEVAKRLSVTVAAVGHWENPNGAKPAVHRLARLAEVFGVDLAWLLSPDNELRPCLLPLRGDAGVDSTSLAVERAQRGGLWPPHGSQKPERPGSTCRNAGAVGGREPARRRMD